MRSLLLGVLWVAGLPATAGAIELTGYLAAEGRLFPESPAFDEQHGMNVSLVAAPELYHEWNRGDQTLVVAPFFRWDQGDSERTHFDLREAVFLHASRNWELRVGLQQVFWGVTESQHLVDIINQTDLVENSDGEDKLGQPLIWFKWIQDFGTVGVYVLPGFRERTFQGKEGRLRFPLLTSDEVRYESDAEEKHVDGAIRWSHSLSLFDLGVAHFHGTSREPRLIPEDELLVPYYDQIDQTSLDVQMTWGGWLWKLEALRRQGQGQTFTAAVGGFEYTLVGILGTVWDLGVLTEYHFDDRGDRAPTPFESDVFVGGRLALNDIQSTAVLAGSVVDLDTGGMAWLMEGSRRLGDRYTLSAEIRAISGTDRDDPLHAFRKDHYFQLELARYF